MTSPPRILLVEDDAQLRQALADHLAASAGFEVAVAASAAEGLALADGRDLVVVDLAEQEGPALCRSLRAQGLEAPLVLLSAGRGAGCGADEVVAKPFRLGALLAKLHELLSRRRAGTAECRIGPWRFDLARRSLRDQAGRTVRLTDKEAAILGLLQRAEGVVARETLLAEVWGYGAGLDTHTLETHVYRLRRKLETADGSPLLVTEPGGYRLRP